MVKNLPANAGDTREVDSLPGSGRSPGGGNVNPPKYSCLENSMDRGAWWVTVPGVTESDMIECAHTHTHQISNLTFHPKTQKRESKLNHREPCGIWFL